MSYPWSRIVGDCDATKVIVAVDLDVVGESQHRSQFGFVTHWKYLENISNRFLPLSSFFYFNPPFAHHLNHV